MVKAAKATEKSLNISKGIIFTFFTFYLIFFGIFISNFFTTSTGDIPLFISYLPLLCYIGAAFCGIGLIIFIRNVTTHKVRQTQSRKKIKAGSIYKQALFLIIFVFAFIPLLSPIIDRGVNTQHFSVYNNKWNGCSEFKQTIEAAGYRNVMTVQSSLSATERLNQSILLILLGPNQFYDPIFEVPYFIDFFNGRNSLLICHDHGSTSTLLWEIFIANILNMGSQNATGIFPVTLFPDGILRDNFSYDTTPEFPVITNFDYSHPTTFGIDEVILSRASSAAGGPLVEFFGWDVVGSASDLYSWVDKNDNGRVDPDIDVLDLGFIGEMLTGFPSDILKLPLYSPFTPRVFMAKELGNSRVFVSADASLFNNELIDDDLGYDNKQFGINIVEWLTFTDYGVNKDNWVVVFDEAHVRPENSRDLSSAGIYGFIMQYIVHLSTNPITAWIYPLLAVYTLKRYLPKKDKQKEQEKKAEEEEKKEEKARFRTSSFFAQKIEEFKDKGKYGDALKLLYRRLERKLNTLLKGEKITTKRVIDMVIAKDPSSTKLKIRRLSRFMERILSIKEGKYKVRTEEDFEELFFEMGWAVNNI